MEKIKQKFDKIHGLPNCCGVVHTAHITFGSQNRDHEKNGGVLIQAIVDPDMRFTNIRLEPSGSMNQSSIFQDSWLFKSCVQGNWLNGSKLKVSSGGGSEVGEYIIGDARYPLRPWLLTPYQFENDISDSESKVEFNRRVHSATTAIALRALARLKDTWKCLQVEGWHQNNQLELQWTIRACCLLHNIVIDMEEEEEGAGMPTDHKVNYSKLVRQVANEDAVRARDILSQHLIESGVHTMSAEEEQEAVVVASSSGDRNKEQEADRRQKADRGKEKVHDS